MANLSGDLIRHKLPTYTFGQYVVAVQQTGSTNTELKRFARQGAPEGTLYIAEEQLVGRGRLDRSWVAPRGSSLLTSLLFRPIFLKPGEIQQLTMMCSMAAIDAIQEHTQLALQIKWPNDIVWRDHRKVGGLLTESEFEGQHVNWVVVGLGLNVSVDFSSFTEPAPDRPDRPGSGHPPLAETATSLSMIMGQATESLRLPILQSYLRNVERRYEALRRGVLPHFEWQRKLAGMGQPITVTIINGKRQITGTMAGVDQNGTLRVRRTDGSIASVIAGDVTLR